MIGKKQKQKIVAAMMMGDRSSQATDQTFDHEFIKVFVRIRPEYNKLTNDIGSLVSKEVNEIPKPGNPVITENGRDKAPLSPKIFKKGDSPARSAILKSNEKVKSGSLNLGKSSPSSRESTPTRDGVTRVQHRRANSSTCVPVNMSPVSTSSNGTPPVGSRGHRRISSTGNNPISNRIPPDSRSTISRRSTVTGTSPSRLTTAKDTSESPGLNSILTQHNECESAKVSRCIAIQPDNKSIRLVSLTRCHCEDCFSKSASANMSMSGNLVPNLSSRSHSVDPQSISANGGKNCQKIFSFEKVFSDESSQEDVYKQAVQNSVSTLFQGVNATVLTYGPPNSGKTFTMRGTKTNPGVMPRAIRDIFAHINKARMDLRRKEFNVEISFVELHNNQFRNLLKDPQNDGNKSRAPSVHDDSMDNEFSTWNAAAKRFVVTCEQDAINAMDEGLKQCKSRRSYAIDEATNNRFYDFSLFV